MKRIAMVLMILTLVPASLANAEIIQIALPDLLGTYPITMSLAERTAAFSFTPPAAINGASFRVSGVATVGSLMCEGTPGPYPIEILAYMFPDEAGWWYAEEPMSDVPGAFTWTAQFESTPPHPVGPSWDFLMDGEGELILFGAGPPIIGICSIVSSPSAIITEAVLILDVVSTVPTEVTTWGQIKAIYEP